MRKKDKSTNTAKRMRWIALVLVTWMIVIIWRLAWVQVVHHDYYLAKAVRAQNVEYATVPTRGLILDRFQRELAYSVISNSLYVDLELLSDEKKRRQAARVLAPIIGESEDTLRAKLTGKARFRWLSRKLDPDAADRIRARVAEYELPGIAIKKETQRFYPNDSLASHLIGFTGSEGQGLAGIEYVWDSLLTGKPGEILISWDAKKKPYDRSELPPLDGATINTTIDMTLQHKLEVLLEHALSTSKAKGAGAIVLNPSTGEILALANAPTFDPNKRVDDSEGSIRQNRAISFPFEPGSVFKMVTYAAAIEEGLVNPDDKLDCGNGEIIFGKRVIHDTRAYGVLNVADAFAKSSNVGAIRLAMRLGKEKLFEYIGRFGFGAKTGIELPGESRGIVNPLERWRYDSIGSVAIGQEISVTMLQIAAAMGAIANHGTWVKPHVIKNIVVQGDRPIYEATPETRPVLSEETSRKMAEILTRVVTHGTARHAIQLEGYTAAGKTGTPQKVDERTRSYSKTKYMPTFAGFVPATKPEFVIVVMVDEPVGLYHGGSVAAPIFNLMAEAALGDYTVIPDDRRFREALDKLTRRYEESTSKELVASTGQVAESVASIVAPANIIEAEKGRAGLKHSDSGHNVNVSPNLSPLAQRPDGPSKKESKASENRRDASMIGSFGMPDFTGRGVRAVAQACAELNLDVRLIGSGIAYRQTPQPGMRIKPGDECRVEFK